MNMQIASQGTLLAQKIEEMLRQSLEGYDVTRSEEQKTETSWGQSIRVRKGMWVGVNIRLNQERGEPVRLHIHLSARGRAVFIWAAILCSVAVALEAGEFLLTLVGFEHFDSITARVLMFFPILCLALPMTLLLTAPFAARGERNAFLLRHQIYGLVHAMVAGIAAGPETQD